MQTEIPIEISLDGLAPGATVISEELPALPGVVWIAIAVGDVKDPKGPIVMDVVAGKTKTALGSGLIAGPRQTSRYSFGVRCSEPWRLSITNDTDAAFSIGNHCRFTAEGSSWRLLAADFKHRLRKAGRLP